MAKTPSKPPAKRRTAPKRAATAPEAASTKAAQKEALDEQFAVADAAADPEVGLRRAVGLGY